MRKKRIAEKTAALKKRKKILETEWRVSIKPFDVAYSVYIALSDKAFRKIARHDKEDMRPSESWSSRSGASCWTLSKGARCVICLEPGKLLEKPQCDVAGMIAHECSHAVDYIEKGVQEDRFGDETRAYMIQWLVENCFYLLYNVLPKDPTTCE